MADETEQQAPIVAAAVADASAAQADAAVAIAETEAAARVEVETLAQETAQAAIEAQKEVATATEKEEIAWLRTKAQETEQALSSLSQRVETGETEIRNSLQQIMERLTPPPLPVVEEEVTAQAPENVAEAVPEKTAQQPARRRHRSI